MQIDSTCFACFNDSYSQADCDAWGRAAGCATSTFVASPDHCTNACSFTSCARGPACVLPHGADAASDAPHDGNDAAPDAPTAMDSGTD